MSATHVLTIAHFPGFADESRLVLRCTAAPEAICRRRPCRRAGALYDATKKEQRQEVAS